LSQEFPSESMGTCPTSPCKTTPGTSGAFWCTWVSPTAPPVHTKWLVASTQQDMMPDQLAYGSTPTAVVGLDSDCCHGAAAPTSQSPGEPPHHLVSNLRQTDRVSPSATPPYGTRCVTYCVTPTTCSLSCHPPGASQLATVSPDAWVTHQVCHWCHQVPSCLRPSW
jgi:hypothetical protein